MQQPTKDHILREIQRLAAENNGVPVGKERFAKLTGIAEHQWRGRYWARFGDAVAEAGLARNSWQSSTLDDDELLAILAEVTRDLGRFPTIDELKILRHSNGSMPSASVFARRFGNRDAQVERLLNFADEHPSFADVAPIVAPLLNLALRDDVAIVSESAPVVTGVVYLLQMSEFYKIGKSNDVGRRSYEVGLQLPEKADLIHIIETDDPSGIEAYWHRRFASQRANGEWFKLSAGDLAAFRRRTYM